MQSSYRAYGEVMTKRIVIGNAKVCETACCIAAPRLKDGRWVGVWGLPSSLRNKSIRIVIETYPPRKKT